jgi:hypothetical protein
MKQSACVLVLVLALLGCAGDQIGNPGETSFPPSKPIRVSHMIDGQPLVLESAPKFAGAMSSMTFRGQQYINADDHGRLMQGAIAYDGKLECLNPTQAGGSRDRNNLGQRSTSRRLQSIVTPDNKLSISTRMAYWLRPGMMCTSQSGARVATSNTTRLSDDIYSIQYRFGQDGHANLIGLTITYDIEKTYESAVVEAITIYTPLTFDTFHSVDLNTGALTLEPTLTSDETPAPLILSTRDGGHAIAFVSRQGGATYARFRFPDTNKISLVYRERNGMSGTKTYAAAMVIGTREEVAARVRSITNGG